MSARPWLLFVPLSACNPTNNPVTANGTEVFAWDNTQSSRPTVATATVGPHTSKDYVVTASPKGAPALLDLHVEVATVDYAEDGAPIHQTSPVAIKATVKANTRWELSGKCENGPNYQMPSVGADGGFVTPLGMIESCTIHGRLNAGLVFTTTWTISTTLNVHGDGTVDPFPADDVTVTPR